MKARGCDRRTFLRRALEAAAGLGLVLAGWTGRAAARAGRAVRIPRKPFRTDRIRDPHDLAG